VIAWCKCFAACSHAVCMCMFVCLLTADQMRASNLGRWAGGPMLVLLKMLCEALL
jgi:hypothetical protein